MKEITALIMTRKGSKRVLNKNIRKFGKPKMSLLVNKIEQLLAVKNIDRIVLNSDCQISLNIAKDMNIELVERDAEYAQDYTEPSDLYKHVAESSCLCDSDYILSASVCYPFMGTSTYSSMINLYKENDFDQNLVAGYPMNHHLLINKVGGFRPLNYSAGKQPNSQDLTDIMSVCFGGIITTKECMLSGDLVGERPYVYEVSEKQAMDIDTERDFAYAEYLYIKDNTSKCCGGKRGCKRKGGCKI